MRSTSCRMWLETITCRPCLPHCSKERDGFGARQRIEAVERLVEDHAPAGRAPMACASLMRCRMPLL